MASGSQEIFLSIVVPVYDEADSLETLHRELDGVLGSIEKPAEILFVDDGSRDDSLARMHALRARDPRVRVIALDGNHGQSAALDAGFRAAAGEVVVTLDADLQNDPRDIPLLLEHLDEADVVSGVRVERRDSPVRRLSSRIANGFRNWMTRESVSDVGCSLRAIRIEPLRRVKPFRGMHRFLPTLLRMEGARVVEVPVGHRARRFGRSKYGIRNRLLAGLIDSVAVRWMQSRALSYQVKE